MTDPKLIEDVARAIRETGSELMTFANDQKLNNGPHSDVSFVACVQIQGALGLLASKLEVIAASPIGKD